MFGLADLKAVYEMFEEMTAKRAMSANQKLLNRFLVTLYLLGENGQKGVSLEQLQEAGWSKMDIFDTAQVALSDDLIIDSMSFGPRYAWLLNSKGALLAQALIEEMDGKRRKKK